MNGSDHLMPQPWLGRVVAEANDLQDDFGFEVTSLPAVPGGPRPPRGSTTVEGELRSGARANMLMGVTSNRVDVKRRGALAERELERRAEPLAALFQAADDYPDRLLELAWREMVRNSAHDSICACSVDDVVDAVLHRYAEARAIAAGLADRAVKDLRPLAGRAGPSVLNPSARARSGVVELVVPADGPAPGGRAGAVRARRACPARWCSTPTRCAPCWACCRARGSATTPGSTTSSIEDTTRGSTSPSPSAPRRSRRAHRRGQAGRLHAAGGPARRRGAGGHGPALDPADRRPYGRGRRVRLERLRAGPAGPPGRGVRPADGAVGPRQRAGPRRGRPGQTAPSRSTASPATAGWSTAATSATPTTTRRPGRTRSSTRPVRHGAGRRAGARAGTGRITRTYRWPDHVDGRSQARVGEHLVDVDTDVELRADEAMVRVTTTFVNPSGDHRLRVHLPLPEPAHALGRRERLRRGDPGPDRRGAARRVRAPHRARQPLRHAPGG